MNFIKKNYILILIVLLFLISLVPLLWIAFYNHPSVDDYNYGVNTINVINNYGIIGVLKGSLKTLKLFYTSWQGTYSAILIMALQPTIFGQEYYFLGTFILLFIFLFSNYYLIKNIIKLLNLDKTTAILISAFLTFISIQTIPSLVQGFYWWNGSCYYNLFYSLLLIEIALILKEKNKVTYIMILLLSIFIAGGNYVTALQQIIFLAIFNIYKIIIKKDKTLLIPLSFSIVGLLISALAPGNAYRSMAVEGMSAFKAIVSSFVYALTYLYKWVNIANIFAILTILMLLIPSYKKIKYNFKYPLLVTLLSFCIFSAQFTPPLYAMSNAGEGRLLNIIYFSHYWLIIINIYYYIGWINIKFQNNKRFKKNVLINSKYFKLFRIIVFMVFVIICYCEKDNMSSIKAYNSISSNEVQKYHEEYKERIEILENTNIKEVTFEEFSVFPEVIFYSDIGNDPLDWRNIPVADIYNKKSVVKGESSNEKK